MKVYIAVGGKKRMGAQVYERGSSEDPSISEISCNQGCCLRLLNSIYGVSAS